ncbi:sensor histidine kinase [Pseudomonas syringae pv. actinidiae]|uniref:histidine kinase n=1 Tax=Pseudomonas syringae pv. actinidiae TaxID=103796 RepID=A0A2V0QGW4_PSESF|nr:sensor histidine kinase [Pseudomonas syringae]MDU8490823.1 sensor histidine kinase [Pseudomonas syringae pv. actinidiae]NVL26207.1 sensor histidine kinase [Pseudomonas syringae pv. actinidiae]NVL33513.1 sensor histidine kinase [Pseudomonas syringae pv. actinidiae]NVL61126.1 sensor histidine kinase [Pseudomonas syringae pv. actinidiae]BBI44092.1 C4-dicarboxylate transport sensor protein DctB [Pseudomonas syringae pv. actinidiae]
MAFKIAARTLLELGKELISSDEVAIYELIKNSVDAKSEVICIRASIVIAYSTYQKALDDLEDGLKTSKIFSNISEKILPDAPEEPAESFLNKLKEAVGSKARFERVLRESYTLYNWMEFEDTGHGMSFEELDDVYLTVGTRSRRKENISGSAYLGDKGVGRLSVMRLGEKLHVRTSTARESRFNTLDIDWTLFDHDSNDEISAVDVEPLRGKLKPSKQDKGTVIKVSGLLGDWTLARFEETLNGPVARMLDPFNAGYANSLIHAYHNDKRCLIPSIPTKLLKAAHASCTVRLKFEDDLPVLTGVMNYHLRNAQRKVSLAGVEVYSVTQKMVAKRGKKGHAAVVSTPIRAQAIRDLGQFEVDVYWYNRSIVEAVAGLTEKAIDTKDQIAKWSGGLMLYRHGFRVLPYGAPDDDWLELDKRAFSVSGFKLNRQQIIGAVRVKSTHIALGEQTNREGLMQSQASGALKALLMWLLHVEFRGFINDIDGYESIKKREAMEATQEFRKIEQVIYTNLEFLREGSPGANSLVQLKQLESNVKKLANQCSQIVGKTEKIIKESEQEYSKLLHLAGIGLITEFIFHELDRTLEQAIGTLKDTRSEVSDNAMLMALEEQLKTLHKRVSAFDEMTGERRQVKSKFDMVELIESILESHSGQLEREGVKIEFNAPSSPVVINAVKGMVIQVLENIISNSMYWLMYQKEYEPGFSPKITIDVSGSGRIVEFSDNGPGIDPDRKEVIFQPLISSKPAGQGRGLGLYISREIVTYHGWDLSMSSVVGMHRKGRLNTFVLNMDKAK